MGRMVSRFYRHMESEWCFVEVLPIIDIGCLNGGFERVLTPMSLTSCVIMRVLFNLLSRVNGMYEGTC